MSTLQTVADRVEIAGLPGEFTDAGMMRDYDRFRRCSHPIRRCGCRTSTSRSWAISELGRMRDGRSHLYRRTPDGWKFAERVYEVRYVDPTPQAGMRRPAGDTSGPR
ncbi:hypothetical protein [Nonomuraea sp. NPDC049709]|uniref:hypothetical protein n=1 Tax=Nonomuraea sp. NPDC049709 TaxID=3154736 RepID=UPI00342C1372